MKRIWCLLLSLCLCVGMVVPALAAGTETRGNFWELVSLTRNTSVNERDNPFDLGKTVTIEWEDGSTEVEYSVVTQNTFWTLTSTGVDSGYNLAQYSISWYHQNSVGNYEFEDGGLQGESELPMTVSFNSPVFRGENTDTGSGEYLYRLYFDVYNFSLEDDVPVEYSFYFMWNEAEAQRIQAELGGGQTPAVSSPAAPTVGGGAAITRANVGTLTEITVPVAYSGNAAQTVTFAVPFYDGNGKFIGVGMKTETVTSSTQSVTVPVSGLSGSESMKVMILGDTFNPLSPVGSYSLPA